MSSVTGKASAHGAHANSSCPVGEAWSVSCPWHCGQTMIERRCGSRFMSLFRLSAFADGRAVRSPGRTRRPARRPGACSPSTPRCVRFRGPRQPRLVGRPRWGLELRGRRPIGAPPSPAGPTVARCAARRGHRRAVRRTSPTVPPPRSGRRTHRSAWSPRPARKPCGNSDATWWQNRESRGRRYPARVGTRIRLAS